ncbi:MAG: signal peptidase II [Sedimentisphaerales bacterium]|nr:signal peptidase II [Sedimentisphaerales bacterium]
MVESKGQNSDAQPSLARAFLRCRSLALPDLTAQVTFWPLMAAGLVLDLWSKSIVFRWLTQRPGNSVSIIDGFLRLVLALNDGGAFGIFSGRPYLLAAVSVVALIVIAGVFFLSAGQHRLVHVALALFAAGVCGNLWDRVFNHGHVRDFIDVYYRDYHWPAFNVADTMLCIGVGLLIISSLRVTKRA